MSHALVWQKARNVVGVSQRASKNVYRGSSQSEIAIVNEEERLRPGLDREAKLSVIEDNIMWMHLARLMSNCIN